jgi:hypothetical protein
MRKTPKLIIFLIDINRGRGLMILSPDFLFSLPHSIRLWRFGGYILLRLVSLLKLRFKIGVV